MKKIRWLVFFVVVIIGGGLNLAHLGALDPNAGKDKMEEAKTELLSKPITTLKIQDCEITITALKLIYSEKEDITLKLSVKNPTKKEVKLTLPLRVYTTTNSSLISRVASPSTPIEHLTQDIDLTIPAENTENKEIVLVQQAMHLSKDKDSGSGKKAKSSGEVTTYSVSLATPDKDNKDKKTLMCRFNLYEKLDLPKKINSPQKEVRVTK